MANQRVEAIDALVGGHQITVRWDPVFRIKRPCAEEQQEPRMWALIVVHFYVVSDGRGIRLSGRKLLIDLFHRNHGRFVPVLSQVKLRQAICFTHQTVLSNNE